MPRRKTPERQQQAGRLWTEFRRDEPELARAGARLLAEQHGYAYLATVRPDGSPRIHPVAPIVIDNGLFIAVQRRSPKLADLRRDPRLGLHACVHPPRDEEFAIRGLGHFIDDVDQRHAVAERARNGARLTETMVLVEIDLIEVSWTRWPNGQANHTRWPRNQ